jgi:hypothetical protein
MAKPAVYSYNITGKFNVLIFCAYGLCTRTSIWLFGSFHVPAALGLIVGKFSPLYGNDTPVVDAASPIPSAPW